MGPPGAWSYDREMSKSRPRAALAKTVLITGASSGIGWATAQQLMAAGHRVFGTGRAQAPVGPPGVSMRTLDVEDEATVQTCVDSILAEAGRLDVLVNNAGRLVYGPVEEVPLPVAQRLFEVNFWGTARMVNAALPHLRAQRDGQVIVVGSVASAVTVPFNGFYAASKAALARYTEALRHETKHLGVRVTLVEPADVATSLWQKAETIAPRLPVYASMSVQIQAAVNTLRSDAMPAEAVGRLIAGLVDEPDPAPVLRVGALTRRMPWLRVLVPARAFERGMRRRFGLDRLSSPPDPGSEGERSDSR